MVDRDIRGGIGQQLLDVIFWLSLFIENGEQINRFIVNTGSTDPVTDKHISHNYIPKMFTVGTSIFETKPGFAKANSWTPKNFQLIAKHIDKVRKFFIPIYKFNPSLYMEHEKFLHVRATDRQFISQQQYQRLTEIQQYYIIGDNKQMIESSLLGYSRNDDDVVSDWRRLYGSYYSTVTGGLSSFMIAAGLLNPTLQVLTLKSIDERRIDFPPFMESCYDVFANNIKNFKWITIGDR